MENKLRSLLCIHLLMLLLAAPLAHAQTAPAPLSEAEIQGIKARADALHREADAQQQAADRKQATDKAACYQRFRVNACLEDVAEAHRLDSQAAHALGVQANTLERDLAAREHAQKAAGLAPQDERKAAGERARQAQEQQLDDFARRAGERAERAQAAQARDAELQKQLQQSAGARQAQGQRNAEAKARAEAARQKTGAYKNAQEQASQRKREALELEKKLKAKKAEPKPGIAPEKPPVP